MSRYYCQGCAPWACYCGTGTGLVEGQWPMVGSLTGMGHMNHGGHLMGGTIVRAPSHFRQGIKLNALYTCDTVYDITGGTSIIDQIEGCLYTTGAFNNVTATCQKSFWTVHGYLLIEGDTAVEFAQASDLTGLIVDTLKNCVTAISFLDAIKTVDQIQVDYIPQQYAGDPNTQQPTTGPGSIAQMAASAASGGSGNPCPDGYFNNSWLASVGGVNCVPNSAAGGGGFDWGSLGIGATTGLIIGGVAIFLLMMRK